MKTLKLVFSFLLVSLLSAGVAIGTYSYLNRKNETFFSNNSFRQDGFRAVGYATPAENTDFSYSAEQSVNAVVHIKSVAKPSERNRGGNRSMNPFEFFYGEGMPYQQRQPQVGFGSGVIISTDGYIVTNHHVIDGADEIEVSTNDGKIYKAKLIGNDDAIDIALLKIEGTNFYALPFGDSDQLKVGEWVLAVGNPFNLTSTVTAGIISAKGRNDVFYDRRNDQQKIQSYIQTDAAVNPGNSGGALVNTRGELIGINTAIITESRNFVGYSFAIPGNIAKKIVSDIKQYGTVQRAMLGIYPRELPEIREKDPDIYNKLKVTEGVYVHDFSANSSSQKAGMQVGDVITAIDGLKVKNYPDLKALLSSHNPGEKIDVQIQRGEATKNFTIELKNDQGTTEIVTQKIPKDILGATFKELSKDAQTSLGINYGVEVTDLKNGKLRSEGIRNGFIILTANDKRISTTEDLEAMVATILKKDPDDRGLYIKGFYPNSRRMEYLAIDLND